MGQRILFTVGHSTHTWDEFVNLLKAWEIEELVDVRTVPESRTFPWFSQGRMKTALPKVGIEYVHLKALGGFRRAKPDSVNLGWNNANFRGYADYMQTQAFIDALAQLNDRRRQKRVCVMCSEAVWWRCHRRMIADAEVIRGIPVKHIVNEHKTTTHELTGFAQVKTRQGALQITYPSAEAKAKVHRAKR